MAAVVTCVLAVVARKVCQHKKTITAHEKDIEDVKKETQGLGDIPKLRQELEAELNKVKESSSQIEKPDYLGDSKKNSPEETTALLAIKEKITLNTHFHTVWRELYQLFSAAHIASSGKVRLSAKSHLGTASQAAVGVLKLGTMFLEGFPLANVVAGAVDGGIDYALAQNMIWDMQHLASLSFGEGRSPEELSKKLALYATMGRKAALLAGKSSLKTGKIAAFTQQLKEAVGKLTGKKLSPAELLGLETTAEITVVLMGKKTKGLEKIDVTSQEIVDAVCRELSMSADLGQSTSSERVEVKRAPASPSKPSVSSPRVSVPGSSEEKDPLSPTSSKRDIDPDRVDRLERELKELRTQNFELSQLFKTKPGSRSASTFGSKQVQIQKNLSPEEAEEMVIIQLDPHLQEYRKVILGLQTELEEVRGQLNEQNLVDQPKRNWKRGFVS